MIYVSEDGIFGKLKTWKMQETFRKDNFRGVVKRPYILSTQRLYLSALALTTQRPDISYGCRKVPFSLLRWLLQPPYYGTLIITGMYPRPPDGHEQCDSTKVRSKTCLLVREQLPNLLCILRATSQQGSQELARSSFLIYIFDTLDQTFY